MTPASVRHVLMTADTVGGVWIHALELAREFGRSGVEVSLATMGNPLRPDQWEQVNELRNVRVYESTYKLEWMEDPWSDVDESGAWLQRLEQDLKPDVVHLNGYAHGSLEWGVPSIVIAHSCVLSWYQAVKSQPAPQKWTEYHRRTKKGLHSAAAVIAVSQAMLAGIARFYGKPERSFVVPNGLAATSFQAGAKQDFVLASGRLWDEAKNINALQDIAPMLSWPVFAAGEGSAQQSGLTSLGRLSRRELRTWFSRAGIYASPALYEPFGLAILEAALSECALVLGDIPSLRENWEGAALFVPPTDKTALREALERLICDSRLRVQMQKAARERSLMFPAAQMGSSYLKIYEQACGQPLQETVQCV